MKQIFLEKKGSEKFANKTEKVLNLQTALHVHRQIMSTACTQATMNRKSKHDIKTILRYSVPPSPGIKKLFCLS